MVQPAKEPPLTMAEPNQWRLPVTRYCDREGGEHRASIFGFWFLVIGFWGFGVVRCEINDLHNVAAGASAACLVVPRRRLRGVGQKRLDLPQHCARAGVVVDLAALQALDLVVNRSECCPFHFVEATAILALPEEGAQLVVLLLVERLVAEALQPLHLDGGASSRIHGAWDREG